MSVQGRNPENFHVEDYLEAVLDNFMMVSILQTERQIRYI